MGKAIVASALALLALNARGATLTSIAEDTGQPRDVRLIAQRLDGPAAAIETKVVVPGASDVALPEGLWELRIVDDALWAAPVQVRQVDAANLRVWPAMRLQGTANGIAKLRAQFAPLEGAEGPTGDADCEIAKEKWTCRLPQGRYDLRFSAPGMAPEFRSAISAQSPAGDLALHFIAGASLYGSVDANTSVEGAEVTLTGHDAQQTTRVNAKGFFQFKGLAPGDYSVTARKKTLIAPSRAVKVLAGVAAEMSEPLRLDTPKKLTLLVFPPLDPDNQPWRVRLAPSRSRDAIEERMPPAGEWSRGGLVAGSYDVALMDDRGGWWSFQTITIDTEDRVVSLAASGTRITGRITLGGRPLQARLSFGGEGGRVLEADEDGRFSGAIPRNYEPPLIFIESDTPAVRRSVRKQVATNDAGDAHLVLDLPATTLMGRVVNGDGSPAHAILTVSGSDDSDVLEQTATDSDGGFQIAGLDEGPYSVVAETSEQKSDLLNLDLKSGEPHEVEIVLKQQAILRGKMTAGDMPVVAAKILAIPRDAAWSSLLPDATTNERGMFQLRFPPGTTVFDGIAVHPAFDTVMARGFVKEGRVAWVPTNQIGGTLTVESTNPGDVFLRHKGAEFPVGTIASLGGGVVGEEQAILPRLEPGEYSVCSRDKSACASGYVPPHGTLTLTISR